MAPRDPPGNNWFTPVCLPGPIAGSTVLPAGFGHPHASEEARKIAEEGMILRVQVGSGVRGTSISGQDVRDEMGLCLEPPQFVTGLARVRITLPVPEPHRARLRSIRQGDVPLADVLGAITSTETQITQLRETSAVPDLPDRGWVDDWLHRSHLNFWAGHR